MTPSSYGVGAWGAGAYSYVPSAPVSPWVPSAPCPPVSWVPSEPCSPSPVTPTGLSLSVDWEEADG